VPSSRVADGVVQGVLASRADHEHGAGPVPCAHESVPGSSGAMEEVPPAQRALLVLDDREALPVEHEKVLLHRLRVVAAGRLPGLHDLDIYARVWPGLALGLELDEGGSSRSADRGRAGEIDDEWLVHRHTILASRRSPDKLPPMSYVVDFNEVSTAGLESSPVADALAGLRANEARYFKNKYDHVFTVQPADEAQGTVDWVHWILKEERDLVISSRPLEATAFLVENIRMAYVFYESGLSINVMYTVDDGGKRAVGFKLSDGMDVPEELSGFKFARQKSRLAGTIRGSYFVIKSEY